MRDPAPVTTTAPSANITPNATPDGKLSTATDILAETLGICPGSTGDGLPVLKKTGQKGGDKDGDES